MLKMDQGMFCEKWMWKRILKVDDWTSWSWSVIKKHEDIKRSEENKDRKKEEIKWSRGLTYSKEFENAVEKYQLKDVVFLKTHIDDTEV